MYTFDITWNGSQILKILRHFKIFKNMYALFRI